jgi:hypothetical protein
MFEDDAYAQALEHLPAHQPGSEEGVSGRRRIAEPGEAA